MRIYDLDYCHSVAPDLLVNGAGTIQLAALVTSSGQVEGFIHSDGSFNVNHNDETTLLLKAEGLDLNNSLSFSNTGIATVERFPNGRISIVKEASSFFSIGGGGIIAF